ncbi:MAG: type II toxin-antitoxin system RelE/ParE family toxin [Muribaculaceae bacterium]
MNPNKRFEVMYLEEAIKFLNTLDVKVKDKILYDIMKSQYEINNELFKKLTDNIWEFRTRYQGIAYRLLAFWDKDTKALVIATHGFIKKKQKTPPNEIKRAEDLMKKYYER